MEKCALCVCVSSLSFTRFNVPLEKEGVEGIHGLSSNEVPTLWRAVWQANLLFLAHLDSWFPDSNSEV